MNRTVRPSGIRLPSGSRPTENRRVKFRNDEMGFYVPQKGGSNMPKLDIFMGILLFYLVIATIIFIIINSNNIKNPNFLANSSFYKYGLVFPFLILFILLFARWFICALL